MIDAATLRKAWEQHSERLLIVARSIGEPAEDAVQEAFIAMAQQPDLPADTMAWLVRVTRNKILQWKRSQKRRTDREASASRESWFRTTSLIDQMLDGSVVTRALQKMKSPHREIVVMHLWGEMTFAAIADVIGKPRATVHRFFQASIEELQQQFHPSEHSVSRRKNDQTVNGST